MPKRRTDLSGLAEKIKDFEKMCEQEQPRRLDIGRGYETLVRDLGLLRQSLYSRMRTALARDVNLSVPAEKPLHGREEAEAASSPTRSTSFTTESGPRYTAPKTVEDLKELLRKTFGVGNKSLAFPADILRKAMTRAQLHYRTEWAVYCTLLMQPGITISPKELEDMTGYNIGSVLGALGTLQNLGLIRTAKHDSARFISMRA